MIAVQETENSNGKAKCTVTVANGSTGQPNGTIHLGTGPDYVNNAASLTSIDNGLYTSKYTKSSQF
jgi:hypothetical protein